MATNIPDEAISIHNDMVDELSIRMTDQEFKKLKRLLEDVPLTETDKRKIKSVQKLFSCLIDKTFVFYGDYGKLKPKLALVKPSLCTVVQRHTEAIGKIFKTEPEPEIDEDITIFMYDTVYKTKEGSPAVFVDCTVRPIPDRIVWKRGKMTPPKTKIPNDNRKFYYSPESPTLVIRDPKKTMDEAQYQCWAEAKGTNADGDIVQLQVAVAEPIKSTSSTSIPGPNEDISQTTTSIPGPSEYISETSGSIPGPSEDISQTTPNTSGPSGDISQTTTSIPGPSADISQTTTSIPGPTGDISLTTTSIQGPSADISQTTTSITGPSEVISQVTTNIPGRSEDIFQTTTSIPGPSEDISPTTINIPPESSEVSDKELESSIHDITTGLETLPRHRKRTRRQSDAQPYGKKVIIDKGCRIVFDVTNEIDIKRQETENDIIDGFERATGVSGRVDKAKLKPKCIQVCIDISAAKHPSEPSSIHLAEEFRHYLLDGGTIQLSDESQTVLQIDETSIQLTPHSLPEDGTPYINVGHGEFTVPVGKTAILQTYVIASTEATSIQWFKVEDGHHIAIEIDNQRYYGGSDVCPTLIIRETTTDDQGQYMCLATNSKGTCSSDTSSLYIVSEKLKKTFRTRRRYWSNERTRETIVRPGASYTALPEMKNSYTLLPEMKTLKEWILPDTFTSIYPTQNGGAWVCNADHTLTLLDKTGATIQKIRHTTWIRDISLSPTTNTVWVCDRNEDIIEFVSGRTMVRFGIRADPLCICSTSSNHVIVGTRGRITKYTSDGFEVLTSPDTDNDKPIVRCPGKISECPVTHNVAVTDKGITDHENCVIVMDGYFMKMFVIDSIVSLDGFYPLDIVFDNSGNLVILNAIDNNIELFSDQGKLLRKFHTYMQLNAIGVDKDNILWLCHWNRISLVQYYRDI